MIVECKGTRSGRNMVLNQLKRGTEQVRAISFPRGIIPSYVIATEMHLNYMRVYVIDPPGEESKSEREISISNEPEFRQAVREVQASNLYRYAGAFSRAYKVERSTQERRGRIDLQDPPTEEYIQEVQTNFVGIRQSFGVPGNFGLVSTFQGIPEQVYLNLNQQAYDNIERSIEYYFTSVRQGTRRTSTENEANPSYFSVKRTDENLTVRLYRRDGTLLQIDVSA